MGGVCLYCPWTCRRLWPLFIFLTAIPCGFHCSQNPPRGNQWAVGHLMGKKSIESLTELQESNPDSAYLTSSETAGVTELGRYEHLMQALMQLKNQKPIEPQTADRLLHLQGDWREEGRDKYLREMSDLLLLALKLQDSDST
uniref:gastrin-releasing peptide n=1 Tax=Monopterus albus TaxID=43700 RepID=UPI0009B3D736|nr:gastrin-releasing peptide-like [Monopterus albus]